MEEQKAIEEKPKRGRPKVREKSVKGSPMKVQYEPQQPGHVEVFISRKTGQGEWGPQKRRWLPETVARQMILAHRANSPARSFKIEVIDKDERERLAKELNVDLKPCKGCQ